MNFTSSIFVHVNIAFTQWMVDGKFNRNISILLNQKSYLVTLYAYASSNLIYK